MKLGIIGTGMIVPEFLENCIEYKDIEISSILSTKRSEKKAREIAKAFNIKKTFSILEDFLEYQVDTVYIGIPNNLHYEYAKKCLNSGKNVIMEKPFTSTLEETKELIQIANDKKLFIFEAISNQFLPNYKVAKELISSLGKIKIVQINFSQYSSRYDDFRKGIVAPVFDKEKGGGALVDLGVYNIYFVVGLFGTPNRVQYFPNIEKGVDTSGILIMEYDSFKCVCINAKDCTGAKNISIQGCDGTLNSTFATNSFERFTISLNNGEGKEYNLNENKHRLYYEIGEFINIYNEKDYERISTLNQNTLLVMEILELAKKYIIECA